MRKPVQLSSEDALRLNVLLANAQAVRIDENQLAVFGLTGEREMKVPLNPTCRADQYLSCVRETLAGAVLDSPGGYPVFLRRWTRMGQIDNEQLDRLLRIGEPEAVMAVVCSPGLTDELARRAWWCAPFSEHARRMLERPQIVAGGMGRVLVEHLIEHLPFETEHKDMLDTVRLVLRTGLIDKTQLKRLWDAGRNRKTYRVAFLDAMPDQLPEPLPAREDVAPTREPLEAMAASPLAVQLLRALDAPGQTFAEVAGDALRRPADQDVVAALLNSIGRYFAPVRVAGVCRDIAAVEAAVADGMASPDAASVVAAVPELEPELRAMLALAHVDENLVAPIFAVSDAVGSVMRNRIEPVTRPVGRWLSVLRGQAR